MTRARWLQVSLKQIGSAITALLSMKDVFTQEAVTGVLSTLVHRQPLPQLLMRTLINTWNLHPDSQRWGTTLWRVADGDIGMRVCCG